MYKSNKLLEMMDPMLNGNFSEDEAIRFLKVALLCVQEKCSLRPHISTAIKMMNGETNVCDMSISQSALITDFMDIKIGQRR
ncbi:hypothetical protein Patl1_06129 [Pistacia atlantica]|uniref:Uncharacterized protein n=1 Tax=Pistacia atlantica TaxID=434234 RepID=A0ACC1BSR1_9ROSI|nr:hypothetical protein Patl1_06129 [Pistacia atlantica]